MTHQNRMIGLATIIIWLIATYGWKQALHIANNISGEEIKIPSFYLTLLVLPVPYGTYRLYKYLTKIYPTVDWIARLASSVFYMLMILLILQGLFLCSVLLIGLVGGGFDIIFSGRTEIILSAVFDFAMWGLLVTFITIVITFKYKKDYYVLLVSLPALVTYGIFFFKLVFLAGMSAKVAP